VLSRRPIRIAVSAIAAGLAASIVLALLLGVLDLYLTGHGLPSLTRPWIDVPRAGIHLSRADVVLLAGALASAFVAAALAGSTTDTQSDW